MSEEVVVVIEDQPPVEAVVVDEGLVEHIVVIEEKGKQGEPGADSTVPGPPGPTGQGVLVLDMGDPIPPDTPDNTVIFRKEPG